MKKASIQTIKEELFTGTPADENYIEELQADKRKGVQKLLDQYQRWLAQYRKMEQEYEDMLVYECHGYTTYGDFIAGVDEVGRGPIAGPVTAAAVILPKDAKLVGLNDSKKLTEAKRELFYEKIKREAISIGVSHVEPNIIDEVNIYQAAKKAMKNAVYQLDPSPDALLVDAMDIPVAVPQQSIVKGDTKSISIAAASVIAKVTRDRYMKELGSHYPGYGFEHHMGYGTKEHLNALEKYGITPYHRVSFAPVTKYTEVSS